MRVVIDTNLFISACWSPGKLEDRVIQLGLMRRFHWFISDELKAEYTEVPKRKKFSKLAPRMEALLAQCLSAAMPVAVTQVVTVSPDPKDNMVLACALACQADYLVTGNTADFPARFGPTHVVNARQFLTANGWLPEGA